MDCCVHGRAGLPEGHLRRLAALLLTRVRGWGDRAEEPMSYAWLQIHTRAKEQQPTHLGEVGVVVDVDAGGGGTGTMPPPCGAPRVALQGQGGPPPQAPKLPANSGGEPSAAKPLPAKQAAAQMGAWVAARAGAMPEWQTQAVAVEGEVLLLRGKHPKVEQRAQEADRQALRKPGCL